MSEILLRLYSGLLHREGNGLSCLSVPRMQRRFGFVLRLCLAGYFLCLNNVFHVLVPPRGYPPLFATPGHFRPRTRAGDEAAAATRPPLYIPEVLGTRKTRCSQRSFLNLRRPGFPALFGRISWSCMFVYALTEIQMQAADHGAVLHSF